MGAGRIFATCTTDGRIIVGGRQVGSFGYDDGDWQEQVAGVLAAHGWVPVGPWFGDGMDADYVEVVRAE